MSPAAVPEAPSAGRTEALEQLGRSFKAALAAVRKLRGRETHRPGELSYAQYGLLFGLADGGARPVGELALAADLSPATATQMLDALATAGLVRRARSQDDKRVVLTSLTEHGSALVAARRARFEPRWRHALRDFSDEELRTAAAILDRLPEVFDDIAEDRAGTAAQRLTR
jgi:DNA-binding MarR family transcriptional regulator